MKPRRLSVMINVADLEKVTAFYAEVLQIPVKKSWNDATGSGSIFDIGPAGTVEFVGPPYSARVDPIPARGVELMIAVDDAEEWLGLLSASAVPIRRALIENPWGDRSFGIDDPEGRRVWIFEVL